MGSGTYRISVIYGRDDDEKELLVTGRKDALFDDLADSGRAYKHECEAAKKEYPHLANAAVEICAELRKCNIRPEDLAKCA